MRPAAYGFWLSILFLGGVLTMSLCAEHPQGVFIAYALVVLGMLACLAAGKYHYALCVLAAGFGVAHAAHSIAVYDRSVAAMRGVNGEHVGVVIGVSRSGDSQQATVRLAAYDDIRVRLTLQRYPVVAYGDAIRFTAPLSAPSDASGYLRKERIHATARFPSEFAIVGSGHGSVVLARLLAFRDSVQQRFERVFPPESATLMTGLVLGKSGGFDKEFSEKLQATGTTHLVALSGYNIAIIINGLLWILAFVLARPRAVWVALLAVAAFVVMTGAEASVVRAALMAAVMVLAERTGRVYSVQSAIAMTAALMVGFQPMILVFDVGFQLSFLALIGIIYLEPALRRLLPLLDQPSVLGWRSSALTTMAAQLMVLPVLIGAFGFFSPLSLITNVLLLVVIPHTMLLGLLVLIAGCVSDVLAALIAFPARLLLGYELGVISFFAQFASGVRLPSSIVVSALYYFAIIGCIMYAQYKERRMHTV